jgi:hypothetical protein
VDVGELNYLEAPVLAQPKRAVDVRLNAAGWVVSPSSRYNDEGAVADGDQHGDAKRSSCGSMHRFTGKSRD